MAIIQWFPGHMAKALRQVKENLKSVDIVLELVDARLPESSRNPQLAEVLQDKPSIIVLTKMDLADPAETKKWINYYESMGQPAIAVNSNSGNLKIIEKKIKEILADKLQSRKEKGIQNTAGTDVQVVDASGRLAGAIENTTTRSDANAEERCDDKLRRLALGVYPDERHGCP